MRRLCAYLIIPYANFVLNPVWQIVRLIMFITKNSILPTDCQWKIEKCWRINACGCGSVMRNLGAKQFLGILSGSAAQPRNATATEIPPEVKKTAKCPDN